MTPESQIVHKNKQDNQPTTLQTLEDGVKSTILC